MRLVYFLAPLIFIGCVNYDTPQKIKNFSKCYINQMPAPFWICYQSDFIAVAKVYSPKISRLKEEEAYNKAVEMLYNKLSIKAKKFMEEISIKDKNFLKTLKGYILVSAVEKSTWYNKKDKLLYVRVDLDKDEFKKFLFKYFKKVDKKKLELAFNEIF